LFNHECSSADVDIDVDGSERAGSWEVEVEPCVDVIVIPGLRGWEPLQMEAVGRADDLWEK
jgi:hypothetical protein